MEIIALLVLFLAVQWTNLSIHQDIINRLNGVIDAVNELKDGDK